MKKDRFSNHIDPHVGYARGQLLRSSADEIKRLRNAQKLTANFVAKYGIDRIGIFTGNSRYSSLTNEDLQKRCEEWVGPGLFLEALRTTAIEHLGGAGCEVVQVFNRTSAGIIASVLALADNKPVLSLVPANDRSHTSVIRGCSLAGVELLEVTSLEEVENTVKEYQPNLFIVTTVTSSLACLQDDLSQRACLIAKQAGATVLFDEAYGARFRPVLRDGKKSLELGGDLAITNTDKAGLSGPRCGVMLGNPDVLINVAAKGAEMGMEARAPIMAGALRSLERFDPQVLINEAKDGQLIADRLSQHIGHQHVQRTELGPMIDEQDILYLALVKSGSEQTELVPAEVSTAVGMLMLRDHGVLTVNTHGQPGGRVSIRLKPTPDALIRIGGVDSLVSAFICALDQVSANLHDIDWFRNILFGEYR